ncbi:hypothetical protein NSA50_17080 [Clostridium sp. DSM 100503]|uniref:hypothetical protein n=1 Tax=Clostridium sp. DSM 100503 TaxID=2963282 RepID=UPI002149CA1A|nr:hypothetical protein [Clostridium sp. DSM 100503]MCR1952739.1 hypothetical protein [Clostridium sp. DSM 100503]
MKKYEFREYIENDLNKEKFEEVALRQIRLHFKESNSKKELSESQEKQMLKQMWENMIESIYQKMKNQIKSKNVEAWKLKIDEVNLVEEINNSFQDY